MNVFPSTWSGATPTPDKQNERGCLASGICLELVIEVVILLIIGLALLLRVRVLRLRHDVDVVVARRARIGREDRFVNSLVFDVEVQLLASVVVNASIGLAIRYDDIPSASLEHP